MESSPEKVRSKRRQHIDTPLRSGNKKHWSRYTYVQSKIFVQRQRDTDKTILVNNLTKLRQRSTNCTASIAAIHNFRVWSHDVSQVYIHSSEEPMRKVYLKPSKEMNLSSDELLVLLKPLYGLPDAGDYYDKTMADYLRNDLAMIPIFQNISL